MILFADIDGVMHAGLGEDEEGKFSRLPLFWKLLRARPEIDVVISSSWRAISTQDELVYLFTVNGGEDLIPRFIGQTPRQRSERGRYIAGPVYVRYTEIAIWLCEHGKGRPWIALDDDARQFPPGCENLLLVDSKTGLQQKDVDEALRRLARVWH
ncbi:MAG: HAD domain-containing protein [Rhodocyclaceae bacterium]